MEHLLGEDLMDATFRSRLENLGLCPRHVALLLNEPDRLGIALALQTLVRHRAGRFGTVLAQPPASVGSHLCQTLWRKVRRLTRYPRGARDIKPSPMNTASPPAAKSLDTDLGTFDEADESCLVCSQIQKSMQLYARTVTDLYRRDPEFRARLATFDGICLPHTRLLIRESYSGLPAATRSQYTHLLRRQLHDGLTRLDQELGWFIQKFDYRFRQADWHNTKSAPERAAARLAGVSVSAGK